MLTDKQVALLREELHTAKNPVFFHDDDADGLASFLLLYRMHREGKGVIVKLAPNLGRPFLRQVEELHPDKIFVLDVPQVDQEFIDQAKVPIFWIDHHQPLERNNIHYFNPRLQDINAYVPTTRMAWQVSEHPEDMWIAVIGCLADHYLPEFIDQFIEKYPYLLPEKGDLATILFQQPVGQLVKMFFFLLKGPTSDVRKSIKILTRITSPDEIMKQETAPGRFLYKRFEIINQKYEELLVQAKKSVTSSKLLLFYYTEEQWSFTANLANELAGLYPKKIVIIARKKSGEMKCSLRAQFPILDALQRALVGINGYGGGHFNACGAVIKQEDWDVFLHNFKKELENA